MVDFEGTTRGANPTKAWNQDDATLFIRLNARRLQVAAKVQNNRHNPTKP